MTITEAAACGTPAVVTRHRRPPRRGAVDGRHRRPWPAARPAGRRRRGGRARRSTARGDRPAAAALGGPPTFTWEATAAGTLGRARRRSDGRRAQPGREHATPGVAAPAARPAVRRRRTCRSPRSPARAALAVVLVRSPGQVSADNKSYLYLDPAVPGQGAVPVGPDDRPGHGHPPDDRLPVARWARTTGSPTASASPSGSPSGSGWARLLFAAGAGVVFLLAHVRRPAADGGGRRSPPSPTCCRRTSSTTPPASR